LALSLGYNCSYASYLLSNHKKIISIPPLKAIQINLKSKIKRKRKPIYKLAQQPLIEFSLLKKEKLSLKERSKTKPGTLIKKQISVRIFNKWDEKRPGFMGNFFTLYVQLWCIVEG